MKFKFTRLMPSVALFCLLLNSCKKNDAVLPNSQVSSDLRNTASLVGLGLEDATATINDIISETTALEANDNVSSATARECGEATYDRPEPPAKFPYTLTLDFGPAPGCTDIYGRTRSGQEIITVEADWRTAPSGTVIRRVAYNNYTINGLSVGNVSTTTVILATAANPGPAVFETITNKTYTDATGYSCAYRGVLSDVSIAGGETPDTEDNVFSVTGTTRGIERATPTGPPSVIWTATIDALDPVIQRNPCAYNVGGTVNIAVRVRNPDFPPIPPIFDRHEEILNYGDGITCNDDATLIVDGGAPEPVTLPLIFYGREIQ